MYNSFMANYPSEKSGNSSRHNVTTGTASSSFGTNSNSVRVVDHPTSSVLPIIVTVLPAQSTREIIFEGSKDFLRSLKKHSLSLLAGAGLITAAVFGIGEGINHWAKNESEKSKTNLQDLTNEFAQKLSGQKRGSISGGATEKGTNARLFIEVESIGVGKWQATFYKDGQIVVPKDLKLPPNWQINDPSKKLENESEALIEKTDSDKPLALETPTEKVAIGDFTRNALASYAARDELKR